MILLDVAPSGGVAIGLVVFLIVVLVVILAVLVWFVRAITRRRR